MTMNPVVHFEMPYEEKGRMNTFYTTVFGWKMQDMGKEMGDYVVAATSESDDQGPLKRGMINGGFFPNTPEQQAKYPMLVISVDDIKEHIKKIEASGGKVLGEPVDIPGIGWYVSFHDTEGNRASVLQPSRKS